METAQDSWGKVPSQAVSSATGDPIARLMRRFIDEYGPPYGVDEDGLRRKLDEWREMLSQFTPAQLQEAGTLWMKKNARWAKVAEVRQLIFDATPRARPSYRGEPAPPKDDAARANVAAMMRVLQKYKDISDTPYTDTLNDPEYQACLDDYTRRTGRQLV